MRITLASLLFVCACSSKSSTPDAPASLPDTAVSIDAPAGTPDAPASQPDAPPGTPDAMPGFTLHIVNELNWCDITVDGVKFSPPNNPPDKVYAPSSVVQLHADPVQGFVWGFWNGTDAGGTDKNQDATATMTADKTVSVCCPISGHATCP
jgi:hypothetical protein